MKSVYRLSLVLFLLATTVGCDQATKAIARDRLSSRPPVSLLGDSLRLVYTENPGAILGIGSELSAELRYLLFVVFAGIFLVVAFTFILNAGQLSLYQLVGLALVIGGGVGNLIDRILHEGRVVDFAVLQFGGLRTGIFNLADVAIFVGIAIFLLASIDWISPRSVNQ